MKRTRLDASAPIDEVNFALAAAVLGELRRKGVSGRPGVPVGAALLDAGTRAAARLPGRMERFDVEAGPSSVFQSSWTARMCRSTSAPYCAILLSCPIFPVRAWRSLRSPPTRTLRVSWPNFAGRASTVVFTDLPDSSRGRSPAELQALATSLGLTSEVEPDAKRALERGLELAGQANAWLLVTGSLYLIGALSGAVGEAVRGRDGSR